MGFRIDVIPEPSGTGTYTPPGVTVPGPSADTGLILRYAVTSNRTPSNALHGATLPTGNVYIYASTTPGQDQVQFTLDGVDVRLDSVAPFDFIGETGGAALPAVGLTAGVHTIGAKMRFGGGTSYTHPEATFTAVDTDPAPDPDNPYAARAAPSVASSIGVGRGGAESGVEALLGRQVNTLLYYPGWRSMTWRTMTDALKAKIAASTFTGGNFTYSICMPMLPEAKLDTADPHTLAAGAGGYYDAFWDEIAVALAARTDAQLKRIVWSLGWEFNGYWYPWGTKANSSASRADATLIANFIAYWRRIKDRIDAQLGPTRKANLLWQLCASGNSVGNSTGQQTDIRACYPGDTYVDILALDLYTFPPGFTATTTAAGLTWLSVWAAEKKKMTAINETATGVKLNMVSGDSWIGLWKSSTTYAVNNVVEADDLLWRATASNTNTDPATDPTKWQAAYQHRGTYSGATVYNKSNIVTYNGVDYHCRATITGVTPGTNSTYWSRAFNGEADGDNDAFITAIDSWARGEVTAKRLKHIIIFENDPSSESAYNSVLTRQRVVPGRDSTVIPGSTRVANAAVNFPNVARKALDLWAP